MPVTASTLRQHVYTLLDQVLETGVPLEVQRKGMMLKIVPFQRPDRLKNLKRRKRVIQGDPQELVHLDWSSEWKP